jgi:PTH1 family peptidyl-tRNA hydrolase
MFLIAGLGNPGDKYKLTRHNIGFLVIDEITKNLTTTNINNSNFKAIVYKAPNTLLVQPQTFMNLSGESIVAIANYYNITNDNIIIIHDDIDLQFGTVKFKIGGGHGGHNGLKSLDLNIGKDYIRIRVGVGKPNDKKDVANYVLNNFNKEELNNLNDIIPHIIKAIEAIKKEPLEKVKSTFTIK